MFKNKNQLKTTVTPDMIAENSDYVWLIFFGELPIYGKRFYSPFRPDRRPGCRWSYTNNQWYLIDNAAHDGKLAWSIYDFVSWMYPTYTNKEVYSIIAEKLLETVPNIQATRRPDVKYVQTNNIRIKFEYSEWTENGYFCREFGIDPEYMNKQPYYKVVNYWANSRKDNSLRKNPFHSPKRVETIAYYFEDSDHTKLYFPEKNDFKWYSNCDANDVFGLHRLSEYDDSHILITKSAKDELILNYHYGINSLAVQSEAITHNEKLKIICEKFNQKIVWYDTDETGQRNEKLFATCLETSCYGIGSTRDGKDVAEIFKSNPNYLERKLKSIIGNERNN